MSRETLISCILNWRAYSAPVASGGKVIPAGNVGRALLSAASKAV